MWLSAEKVLWGFLLLTWSSGRAQCREPIKPSAEVGDLVKALGDLQLHATDGSGPPCSLDIQRDLPKPNEPQPLYIIPNTDRFWPPNEQGLLQVERGASIELFCSKAFANATDRLTDKGAVVHPIPKNTRTIRARCLHDKTFEFNGAKYEFRQFVCDRHPRYAVERLGEKCADTDARMYRVGFNTSSRGERFLETMRLCHDDDVLRTHYVHHVLLPASVHYQKFVRRLNFSRANFFRDFDMNFLYSQKNQHRQASVLLEGQHGHLFDNNTLYLARGHLAAKADFIYGNQQRSTFTFFNVAPQWQAFNGGQWSALEDGVRKFVARAHLVVDCYTGTWGTMQLPFANATQWRHFYLTHDANNNGLLPVPQLFYRVLVDRVRPTRGIALVGVNNPFATLSQIRESYVICEDVREQVPWVRTWMRNKNLKKGYMYACQVAELVAVVGHLPKHLNGVTELLL